MKQTSLIFLMTPLLVSGSLLSCGCRTATEGNGANPWSRPFVSLSGAKKGDDVTSPASKADPKVTSDLAHQRAGGRNPLSSLPNDRTLRPDEAEMANLSRIDGEIPLWATRDSAATASPPYGGASEQMPPSGGLDRYSEFRTAPPAPAGNTLGASEFPELFSASPDAPPGGLPRNTDSLPNYLPPDASPGNPGLAGRNPNYGNPLPDSLDGVPPMIDSTPARTNFTEIPVSYQEPTKQYSPGDVNGDLPDLSDPFPPAYQEPPKPKTATIFFAPGNIDPNYPDRPGR